MSIDLSTVNWTAVGTAAFGTFLLGGVWYTVLFGNVWKRLHGIDDAKVKEMQVRRPPPVFFSLMLIAYLVVATVLALLIGALSIQTAAAGALLGIVLWLGLAAAIGLTAWLPSDKPLSVFAIDWLFQLIFLAGMGATLGAWR